MVVYQVNLEFNLHYLNLTNITSELKIVLDHSLFLIFYPVIFTSWFYCSHFEVLLNPKSFILSWRKRTIFQNCHFQFFLFKDFYKKPLHFFFFNIKFVYKLTLYTLRLPKFEGFTSKLFSLINSIQLDNLAYLLLKCPHSI